MIAVRSNRMLSVPKLLLLFLPASGTVAVQACAIVTSLEDGFQTRVGFSAETF